jgi:hypothetical protein
MVKEAMNPYPSIKAITDKVGPLPHPYPWRMVNNLRHGQINGIERISGTPVATNGILIALEECGKVQIGHRDWFVPDPPEPKPRVTRADKSNSFSEKLSVEFV